MASDWCQGAIEILTRIETASRELGLLITLQEFQQNENTMVLLLQCLETGSVAMYEDTAFVKHKVLPKAMELLNPYSLIRQLQMPLEQ